jgi:hypothetical protein
MSSETRMSDDQILNQRAHHGFHPHRNWITTGTTTEEQTGCCSIVREALVDSHSTSDFNKGKEAESLFSISYNITEVCRLQEIVSMSCLGEGFDWVCAKDDDSILVSRINSKARGPLEVLLATFDYYPQKTVDRVIIGKPDQSAFISTNGENMLGDEVRGPPEEGHHLELEELTLNEICNENNDPMQSPEFVPHVDEKRKAQSRAKELEELRQMNLAKLNGKK